MLLVYFGEGDIKKCFTGKIELRYRVVPSVFPWIRTSPHKRKEPVERNFELTVSQSASQHRIAVVVEESSNKSLNEMVPDLPDCSF